MEMKHLVYLHLNSCLSLCKDLRMVAKYLLNLSFRGEFS